MSDAITLDVLSSSPVQLDVGDADPIAREEIAELATRVTTVEGDVSGLSTRMGAVEGDISTLGTTVDGIDARVEAIEADGSVTTAKLADGAVTTAKLADGAVTDAKLAQTGGVLSEVHDIRTGFDGAIYASAGNAMRRQVSDLQSNMDSVFTIEHSVNLLNPENVTVGYFYKACENGDGSWSPILRENAAYACAFVDVKEPNKYTITKSSYAAYNVNADGQIVGNIAQDEATPIIIDTSVKGHISWGATGETVRIYFSWRFANYPVSSYMAVKGETMPSVYVPYGVTKSINSDVEVANVESVTEYHVRQDGTGDYTTLMGAFVDLADDDTKKIIYVQSGTYDIYDEIGGSTFVNSIPSEGASYWDYVTLVPENTSVIGIGGVTLEYLPDSVPEVAAQFISPINISDGDVHLENLKIVCKNCRYAIHDQTREDHPNGYTHTYKNVVCIKDSAAGQTGYAQALGGGLNQGAYIEFDSCVFESYRTCFSYHNATRGYANIVAKNCVFNNLIATRGSYPSVRFGNVSGVQTHVPVNISGSYMNDGVLITNESSTERPNAFDLTLVNCTGDTSVDVTNATNIYTPRVYGTA